MKKPLNCKKCKDCETIENIMRSAINEFGLKGYCGARVQTIADNANISKTQIFYYFKNKDTLYIEIIKYFFNELYKTICIPLEKENDLEKAIDIFVDGYFHVFKDNPSGIRIIATEFLGQKHLLSRFKKLEFKPWKQYFQKIHSEFNRICKFDEIKLKNFIFSTISLTAFTLLSEGVSKDALDIANFNEFLKIRKIEIKRIIKNSYK